MKRQRKDWEVEPVMASKGSKKVGEGEEDEEAVILYTRPNMKRKATMKSTDELSGQRSPLSASVFQSPTSPSKPARARPGANLTEARKAEASGADSQAMSSNTGVAKKANKSYASPPLLKKPTLGF